MLYKRSNKPGAVYWTRFTLRGRKVRVSCLTDCKSAAEEFERALREKIWREVTLGEETHLWDEAVDRWLAEKQAKRSLQRDRDAFAALKPLLEGVELGEIDEKMIAEIEKALGVGVRKEARSAGTVARMVAVLRAVLNRAALKWKWISAPPKFEVIKPNKPVTRWINQAQFDELFRELPAHAAAIVRFAVATGLRSHNLFTLRWRDVDLDHNVIRFEGAAMKSGEQSGFPLSPEARVVIEQQRGAHVEYVFCDHKGRAPIGSIKTCWKKACIRAGVPGLRVHDLRHTFAAWHKLAGTPDAALQSLGGWSDPRMVQRYGQVAPTGFAHFADNRRLPEKIGVNGRVNSRARALPACGPQAAGSGTKKGTRGGG